ncbi:kinase APK1A, chloroplast precursor, partial [Tanacetum coccineum]
MVDGPVLYFITVNKLSLKDIKEVLNDDQAQFVTTNCVLREMEVFYHKYSGSAQMLKSIEVAKAFDVVPCMHQKEVSAEQCIRSVVGIKNSCKMFVAVVANCSWPLLHKDPTIPIIIADNKTFGLKQLSSREQRLAKKWCADYPIEKPAIMEDDSPLPYDHPESPEYKRLMARIEFYHFAQIKCRALSEQLTHSQWKYKQVRAALVEQMRSNQTLYEEKVQQFLDSDPEFEYETYSDYVDRKSEDKECGDSVMMQAAADR